jgi:D-threonate/D-erythronate kinase
MGSGKGVTCLIVADDLTGAADACAPFVERGLSGVVRLDAIARRPAADVVAISTESRGLSPAEAADVVLKAGGFGGLTHSFRP